MSIFNNFTNGFSLFGLLLFLIAWIIPGNYPPWPSFQQEILTAVGFFLMSFPVFLSGVGQRVLLPWSSLAVFALVFFPVIQWLTGQIHYLSGMVLPVGYLVGFSLTIVLFRNQFLNGISSPHWPLRCIGVLIVASLISVCLALFQWQGFSGFWLADIRAGARPYANIAQPNHLATLCGLGLVGVWLFYECQKISGRVAWLLIGWLLLGLAMTQSRTGWLFFIALVLYGWSIRRRIASRVPNQAWWWGIALFMALVWFWPWVNTQLLITLESSWDERASAGTRGSLWSGLLEAVVRSPWFGWGWGQTSTAQHAVALDQAVGQRMLNYAHNIIVDLCLWIGVPATLLLMWGVFLWLRRNVRTCRSPLQAAALSSIMVISFHAMTEYPLAYLYFLLPAGMFVGILETYQPPSGVAFHRGWLSGLLVAVGFLMGCVIYDHGQLEQSELHLRMNLAKIGDDAGSPVMIPKALLLDQVEAYQRLRLFPAHAGMSQVELNEMKFIVQQYPHPPALMRHALAFGLNGQPRQAHAELVALCHLHPRVRCDEARVSWRLAQDRYPVLKGVSGP